MPINPSLESQLQSSLRSVPAPPELWDRIQTSQLTAARPVHRRMVWALATAVVLAVVGLSIFHRDNVAFQSLASDHCENPAQLRAWVRAKTGLSLPLRSDSSQLIGAQTIDGSHGVRIAYRAGNRDAVLLVLRADASSNVPHIHFGQRFAVSTDNPVDLQLACRLCHLD